MDSRKTVLAFVAIASALPLLSCSGDPNTLSKDQVAVYRAVLKRFALREVSIQTIPFGDPLFRDDVGSCVPGIHLLTPSIVRSSHRLTPDVLPGREWSLVDPAHYERRCDSPTFVSEILFDRWHRHAVLGTAKDGSGELHGYVYVLGEDTRRVELLKPYTGLFLGYGLPVAWSSDFSVKAFVNERWMLSLT